MLFQHRNSTLFIKVSFPAVSSCVRPAIDDEEDEGGKTANVAPDVRRCVVSGSTRLRSLGAFACALTIHRHFDK